MKRKIVFATNNKNKLAEVSKMLKDDYTVLSLADIGCEVEIPETGETLKANAFQKAQFVWENYNMDCFADDTGLIVNSLDGEPGVYSARYAGEHKNSEDNMKLLLKKLMSKSDRTAQFNTVICLLENGKPHYFEGEARGVITVTRAGREGFGYDPIFRPAGFQETFAELNQRLKNEISHRGKAVRKLVKHLKQG